MSNDNTLGVLLIEALFLQWWSWNSMYNTIQNHYGTIFVFRSIRVSNCSLICITQYFVY